MKDKERTVNNLTKSFILIGLIEVFLWVFIFSNFLAVLIGVSTVIPAYIAVKEKKYNLNYFVAIWALCKYNPITLAIIAFILSDIAMTFSYSGLIISVVFAALVFLSSLIMGIILLIKTIKYKKSIATQKIK